jgi:RNA polymerase sigma factor (sigma-70 family)
MNSTAMATPPRKHDLDLSHLEDEELVVLAREWGYRPARDELIHRCLGLAKRIVGQHANRWRLQEADRQDAQQDAVLWIVEAIDQYRTSEHITPGGCHFRSFLYRVLAARFIDFLRHRDYLRRRFPPTAVVFLLGKCATDGRRHRGSQEGENSNGGEVPAGVEEGELRSRLAQELDQVGAVDRLLWDLLAAGTPLKRAALALNLSYDAVKRRRQKLIVHLRISLVGP